MSRPRLRGSGRYEVPPRHGYSQPKHPPPPQWTKKLAHPTTASVVRCASFFVHCGAKLLTHALYRKPEPSRLSGSPTQATRYQKPDSAHLLCTYCTYRCTVRYGAVHKSRCSIFIRMWTGMMRVWLRSSHLPREKSMVYCTVLMLLLLGPRGVVVDRTEYLAGENEMLGCLAW